MSGSSQVQMSAFMRPKLTRRRSCGAGGCDGCDGQNHHDDARPGPVQIHSIGDRRCAQTMASRPSGTLRALRAKNADLWLAWRTHANRAVIVAVGVRLVAEPRQFRVGATIFANRLWRELDGA